MQIWQYKAVHPNRQYNPPGQYSMTRNSFSGDEKE
jgi:hypothetical protein